MYLSALPSASARPLLGLARHRRGRRRPMRAIDPSYLEEQRARALDVLGVRVELAVGADNGPH